MSEERPARGRRVFLAVAIAICLLLAGPAAYRGIEHAVLHARLRNIKQRIAVMEARLERYENLMRLLNDSSLTRLADSLKAAEPDTTPR